jgi:fructokinase
MNDNLLASPVIFGEVLFDCFPDGNSVLGGAPFNVAWHLQAFGLSPLMISAIGDDELGQKVTAAMQDWNMGTTGVQIDSAHPTGSVSIEFDNGEPRYTIVEHRAYDYIDADLLPSVAGNRIFYHGSLALRNQTSRQALARIKQSFTGNVFLDVNLRDPWWQKDYVLSLADDANWVKLNEGELQQLGSGKGDYRKQAEAFVARHNLNGLIVTLGEEGAMAITDEDEYAHVQPVKSLEVVDTVGAGDAFTSVLILALYQQWPLQTTIDRAQEFASLMVARQGATVHDRDFYQSKINAWGL